MYRMVKLGRVRLLNVLAEAALIVFSILLALYTNHWREQHSADERLQATLADIRVELQDNQAILEDMVVYHQQTASHIGEFLAAPDLAARIQGKSAFDLLHDLMPRGIWNPKVTPSILSDSAWRSAVASGSLAHMEPKLLNKLTTYYSLQQAGVQNSLSQVEQELLAPPSHDPAATVLMIKTFQGWVWQLSGQEQLLLGEVKATLKVMPPAS